MNRSSSLEMCCALDTSHVVGIAADHGGHELKEYLVKMLREAGAEVIDFGNRQLAPDDDYPDFVVPLARAVVAGQVKRGIAICGSGVGACIAANKIPGVRACLVHDPFSAHQGVEDDDLNLICLGGLVVGHALAWELVKRFLVSQFSGKERHRRRLEKVTYLENHQFTNAVISPEKAGAPDEAAPLSLYLIRHGETDWSISGQYTGRTDLPLTAQGEAAARKVGERLKNVSFAHVLMSPLQRARQTCALAALKPVPEIEPNLAEWNNGDYEGRTPAEIRKAQPEWNLFRDGAPNGETPAQISGRVDRLIARLRTLDGNVALFSHGHLCRVLAARWIGLSVEHAERLLLNTASISILSYAHDCPDEPAIALWNAGEMKAAGFQSNSTGRTPDIMKKLIVFDLDGTLAESKSPLDAEMATLLAGLLAIMKVSIISGGNWPQFEKQILSHLPQDKHLKNLSLLPTCGTKFYEYKGNWEQLYSENFTAQEKEKIIRSLENVSESSGFKAAKVWGEVIEDRGSQVTFSALGQQAPIAEKKKWDADFAKRKTMKASLDKLIPEFSVRLGGTTSIDVTKPGIDKAYGIRKLRDTLGIAIDEMMFVGDALFPGGNDYPAKEAGALSIQVRDPNETKRVIEAIIACRGGEEEHG